MARPSEQRPPASTDREPRRTARVVQVNVSGGGVPKRPVHEARVGPLGLAGDAHVFPKHGGEARAVVLLSTEAIARIAGEGHPIAPGTTGENLTIEGLDVGLLPLGTRLAVGDEVVLELTKPAEPCETIAGSFRGGDIDRISSRLHPADARMCARVVREGVVRPGDAIEIPAPVKPG